MIKLSVLDQSPISDGSTATQAFSHTVTLAQEVEKLGYTRFWVSEHHNSVSLAGSSPEILISHIAAKTERMRVGSGGVMLPHYSPYKVAENFRVLEALYPNRIDLGVGRAPAVCQLQLAHFKKEKWSQLINIQNKLQMLQCIYMIKYQKTIIMRI